jgi:hypothetical protein
MKDGPAAAELVGSGLGDSFSFGTLAELDETMEATIALRKNFLHWNQDAFLDEWEARTQSQLWRAAPEFVAALDSAKTAASASTLGNDDVWKTVTQGLWEGMQESVPDEAIAALSRMAAHFAYEHHLPKWFGVDVAEMTLRQFYIRHTGDKTAPIDLVVNVPLPAAAEMFGFAPRRGENAAETLERFDIEVEEYRRTVQELLPPPGARPADNKRRQISEWVDLYYRARVRDGTTYKTATATLKRDEDHNDRHKAVKLIVARVATILTRRK